MKSSTYAIDLSPFFLSRGRLQALAQEFNGTTSDRAGDDLVDVEFTPMKVERYDGQQSWLTPYDLSQKFINALQGYKK